MAAGTNGTWTVSRSGSLNPICTFDTFLGFRFRSGTGLPFLPLEKGAFTTINKWKEPYRAQVTLAKSGEQGDIETMLVKLESYKDSTDLVDIVTPFYTFTYGNVQDIEYGFSDNETGSSMAVVTISIQEIRTVGTSESFTDITGAGSKNSDCVSTSDGGNCQATALPSMPGGR